MPKAQVTLQVWYVLLSHWDQNIFKITFKLSCLYDISPLVNYQSFIKVKFEEISCKAAAKGIYIFN